MQATTNFGWVSGLAVCVFSACGATTSSEPEAETESESSLGTWAEPVLLNGEHAAEPTPPEIAMNDGGQALVLWSDITQTDTQVEQRLWSARYTPDEGWTPAELLRAGRALAEYRIAVDENGDGMAIWSESADTSAARWTVWATRFRADSGWDTAQVLDDGTDISASSVALSMNPRGQALAVWTDTSETNMARARPFDPETGWASVETISTGTATLYGAGIALCADGSALAMWGAGLVTGNPAPAYANLWVRRYDPRVGWAEAVPSPDWTLAGTPQLECGGDGTVAALWGAPAHPQVSTWFARYDASGAWTGGLLDLGGTGSRMALDGAGNALVVEAESFSNNGPIEAFLDQPSVGLVDRHSLESGTIDGPLLAADVASNDAGQALAIWSRTTARGEAVWINGYTAGEGWGESEQLTSTEQPCADACRTRIHPRIAMDAAGNAAAVWTQRHDAHGDLWAQVLTR